jgi:hypothetical protein
LAFIGSFVSTATNTPDVLTAGDLRDVDTQLLEYLREGRVTPAHARERLTSDTGEEYSRGYIQQRLSRLEEHGHATNLGGGLYELVDDPRDEGDQDATDVDLDALRAAIADARDAYEDVDGDGLGAALTRAEELLGMEHGDD